MVAVGKFWNEGIEKFAPLLGHTARSWPEYVEAVKVVHKIRLPAGVC